MYQLLQSILFINEQFIVNTKFAIVLPTVLYEFLFGWVYNCASFKRDFLSAMNMYILLIIKRVKVSRLCFY